MQNTNETRNGLTFDEWLRKVDAVLAQRIGLSHDDLEDFRSYDTWDSEASPEEGADACMENDSIYCEAMDEDWD